MEGKKVVLLVAAHKAVRFPEDDMYCPIQVGSALHPSFHTTYKDDIKDNISSKNPTYCELTALYWGWKNLDSSYMGLVHYRRFFATRNLFWPKWERIASQQAIEKMLRQAPIILPKKRHYWIETNYSQYVHAHHSRDLLLTRAIIAQREPDYLQAFDRVMQRTAGHRFNMFIMERSLLDSYCRWLFGILGELEAQLDLSDYTPYDRRVFGFVGERLLDVWLEKNPAPFREIPVVFTERQNWLKKVSMFLLRKFRGGKTAGCIPIK